MNDTQRQLRTNDRRPRKRPHPMTIVNYRSLQRSLQRSIAAAGRYLVVTLALLVATVPTRPAHATSIVVTTTNDEGNTDGDCALREAIRAANQNVARDACPAGQNDATDTITLQSGASYSLVLSGAENGAASGDLDIVNNAAASDIVINVADGGTATISQDASPDERIFEVFSTASLELDDVVLQGGLAPDGTSGGAIATNMSSTLVLRRCLLIDNVATNQGGAVLSKGTLIVDGTTFERNTATNSGGAIATGSGSTTSIDGASFGDNVASGTVGGAIVTSDELTVTATSFVDNRAELQDAAVAISATTADAVQISSSCFIGNDGGVLNLVTAQQDASGNWWGANDGPSGAGPGSGDSVSEKVDFSGFLTVPPAACLPLELLANGGFESYDVNPDLPDRWRTRRLVLPDEGLLCTEDGCDVELEGGALRTQLLQSILVSGNAGDTFTFAAQSSAIDVPATGGKYLVELRIIHADGSSQSRVVKFSAGTHGAEVRSKTAVASEPYVRLKVRVEYSRPSGVVRFDEISVVKEQ